eukprot:2122355-Lingulodinium_polyedra.AAC.1
MCSTLSSPDKLWELGETYARLPRAPRVLEVVNMLGHHGGQTTFIMALAQFAKMTNSHLAL